MKTDLMEDYSFINPILVVKVEISFINALKGLNLCFNIMNVKLCLLNQEVGCKQPTFLFLLNSPINSLQNLLKIDSPNDTKCAPKNPRFTFNSNEKSVKSVVFCQKQQLFTVQ